MARPSKMHAFQGWINQITRINECRKLDIAEDNLPTDNSHKGTKLH